MSRPHAIQTPQTSFVRIKIESIVTRLDVASEGEGRINCFVSNIDGLDLNAVNMGLDQSVGMNVSS